MHTSVKKVIPKLVLNTMFMFVLHSSFLPIKANMYSQTPLEPHSLSITITGIKAGVGGKFNALIFGYIFMY
jgi:hypothetical protein